MSADKDRRNVLPSTNESFAHSKLYPARPAVWVEGDEDIAIMSSLDSAHKAGRAG